MRELVFNIKALSKINRLAKNKCAIRFYRSPNLDMLKQNKIRETNILAKLLKVVPKERKKKLTVHLNKKKQLLEKLLSIRATLYENRIKTQIHDEIFRNRLNKFAKLIIYYFARWCIFWYTCFPGNTTYCAKTTCKF